MQSRKTSADLWHQKPYYSLDAWCKNTYGRKLYKAALDIGCTCPNRDGTLDTRGCIFCSAGGSGDFAASRQLSVTDQLTQAKALLSSKWIPEPGKPSLIAYFQAYTNTYAPTDYLRRIFTEAIEHPDIVALSIATRCDCLPEDVIALLRELNQKKPVWVELGLQTIHEETLSFIRSGFTLEQYHRAVSALAQNNIPCITHLILGLPGESKEQMLSSVAHVASLPVSGIKLQLLHVLKNTDLGTLYEKSPFPLFSLEEYCNLIADCIALLPPEMVIHRLTGDGPKNLLLAPLWSADKKRVMNTIQKTLRERDIYQGMNHRKEEFSWQNHLPSTN